MSEAQVFTLGEEEKTLVEGLFGESAVVVDPGYKANVTLKEEEAYRRADLISDVEYDFQLALNKGKYYAGQAVINFYLHELPKAGELFVNLQAMALADLQINDFKVSQAQANEIFHDQRIKLEQPLIEVGWNTVTLKYVNQYNTNRVGLHTFTDDKDKQQYLYSQFEAFHCFRVFPVFDQPNLKAKMSLTAVVPGDWKAVSNSIEQVYPDAKKDGHRVLKRHRAEWFLSFYEKSSEAAPEISLYDFEQTPKISTYLYAICAGPYKVYEDYDPMHTPQRIFVRQSLAENLRHELMFGVTKTTISLYQKAYGQRYPFSKVDHVMSPDYKYGAMENVGCITYSDEIMCAQKQMSIPQLTFFVVVVQHELCHMWFGNLVTMKWWNDLWLNEAFATALSYKACSLGGPSVDEFANEAWLHMAGYKRWGLGEDLMPSNHKIQANCPTTDTAESLIDGITYGKGSSMIKQLIFLMGWETFTVGLRKYFAQFKWTNTTLDDFIGSLQTGYNEEHPDATDKLNLKEWSNDWLVTKGANKIQTVYTQEQGKFTSFKLRQTHCKYADEIYRKQRFNIGFYDEDGTLLNKVENVLLEAKEMTEVSNIVGMDVPPAVLLNSDDWGFGYFELDDTSVKVFESCLSRIGNQLDRAVIIGQIIVMVRQLAYPATRLPTVMNQLMEESNQNLINALVGALLQAQSIYLPPESLPKFNKEVAEFFFKKAKKESGNAALQMFCIDKAIQFVTEQEHLSMTASWIMNEKIEIEGEQLLCELTNEHKYAIIKAYYASKHFTLDEKHALKAKTFEKDDSDNAQKIIKVCEWSVPEEDLKQKLWAEITDPVSKDSLLETRMKIQGFFQRKQQLDLLTPYFDNYYSVLGKLLEQRDREFVEVFMQGMSPAFMARDSDRDNFTELLNKAKTETPDREFFILFLKKQIETIEITSKSRSLCENFRMD